METTIAIGGYNAKEGKVQTFDLDGLFMLVQDEVVVSFQYVQHLH